MGSARRSVKKIQLHDITVEEVYSVYLHLYTPGPCLPTDGAQGKILELLTFIYLIRTNFYKDNYTHDNN